MHIDEILSFFSDVKPTGTSSWKALCPVHDDSNASLSIANEKGRVLLHCHAGCAIEEILATLDLSYSDLFNEQKHDTTILYYKTYPYYDVNHTLLYTVHRQDFNDGSKKIWQEPHGTFSLKDTLKLVPFQLQEMLEAIKKNETIYIVEGEKCVRAAEYIGLTATTNPMGAGKWHDHYSAYFTGAKVVILPDNDDIGKEHADKVLKSIAKFAQSVKIVELPVGKKGDIADFIIGGGTREALEKIVADTAYSALPMEPCEWFQNYNASCTRFSDDPEPIDCIIEDILPKGIVSLLYSAGGAGKSTLGFNWILKMLLAEEYKTTLFGKPIKCGRAVILNAEDPERIINQRLINIGKALAKELSIEYKYVRETFDRKLSIFSTVGSSMQFFAMGKNGELKETDYFKSLKKTMKEMKDLSFILVDTKARFSPSEGLGNAIATQEIGYYEALSQLTGATVMLFHHTNKGSRDGSQTGAQAFRDASAIFDSVRAAWFLRPANKGEIASTAEETGTTTYLFLEHSKSNYALKQPNWLIRRDAWNFSMSPLDKQAKDVIDTGALIEAMTADGRDDFTKSDLIKFKIPKFKAVLEEAIFKDEITEERVGKTLHYKLIKE